jgi:hypothetical protein
MRDICLLEQLSGKRLNRTRQMIPHHGFVGMVERIVTKKGSSPGFALAVKYGVMHTTFEQRVLENPTLFSAKALRTS